MAVDLQRLLLWYQFSFVDGQRKAPSTVVERSSSKKVFKLWEEARPFFSIQKALV